MRRKHQYIALILLLMSLVACPKSQETENKTVDPAKNVRDQVLIQLSERSSMVANFHFVGLRCLADCDQEQSTTQKFSLTFRAPNAFRIEIPQEEAVITFDGKMLITVSHKSKTAQHLDLDKMEAADATALAYQILNPFVVEGWRAPLLAVKDSESLHVMLDPQKTQNEQIVAIKRMLVDDELAFLEYRFRLPKADFVGKRFVRKDAKNQSSVLVTAEHKDGRSGCSFPASWSVTDAKGKTATWTRLENIEINAGVAKEAFQQIIPEGFSEFNAASSQPLQP